MVAPEIPGVAIEYSLREEAAGCEGRSCHGLRDLVQIEANKAVKEFQADTSSEQPTPCVVDLGFACDRKNDESLCQARRQKGIVTPLIPGLIESGIGIRYLLSRNKHRGLRHVFTHYQ